MAPVGEVAHTTVHRARKRADLGAISGPAALPRRRGRICPLAVSCGGIERGGLLRAMRRATAAAPRPSSTRRPGRCATTPGLGYRRAREALHSSRLERLDMSRTSLRRA